MSNRISWFVIFWLVMVFAFLYAPIISVVVYSFNASRLVTVWAGWSFKWYGELAKDRQIIDAAILSLEVAAISATLATILGTIAGYVLVRFPKFMGRTAFSGMVNAPLVMPEVITGLSLLLLFISMRGLIGWPQGNGMTTVIIAHVTFTLSYVAVVMRSRFLVLDLSLEEAAQDLGATGLQTFRLVTFPLIAPGIAAAALLAFALSVDDFVVTNFNAGDTVTFPVYIWGAARISIPPQVNVMATIIFLLSLVFMLLTVWEQRHAQKMTQTQG
jgi:putrescine transport system permease protein